MQHGLLLQKQQFSAPRACSGYAHLLETEAAAAAVRAEETITTAAPHAFRTVAFYHLTALEDPEQVLRQHRQRLDSLDIRGRIYLSHQGINAQFSGPAADTQAYIEWVSGQSLFQGLFANEDAVPGHMFPRLRLAVKPNLVQLAGGMSALPVTDPQARARAVGPAEWQALLRQAQPPASLSATEHTRPSQPHDASAQAQRPVVLDVRNGYEWDAGHFEGAARPLEDNFQDTPTDAAHLPAALEGADPATTPVMMYCTGGIRCDVYSTHLRRLGFQNLMSLQGGIQNYLKQAGREHWQGNLFVFDGRLAVGGEGERSLVAAQPCALCGGQAVLPHMNCANIDCNRLFLACANCRGHMEGCCSPGCLNTPARLKRPLKARTDYHLYGRWQDALGGGAEAACTSEEAALASAAMASGRGEGRALRRQRRAEKLRDQSEAKREERQARKAMARAAMQDPDDGALILYS
ncbi:hypothetical protein WJX73_010323 [Symbiochloris irregularis]|uniref:Rhodanese domain-containing protein n=1 Tax=Symbiochloris irregularis TaxID=706552 RepID=A0AAW1PBW5_9CHLO